MTERYQLQMIANGALVMIAGMIAGIFFTFHLVGEFDIPGSVRGWRAAHVGNILNGMMVITIGGVLGRLSLSPRAQRWTVWGLIGTVWCNALFYFFANLAPNRGLSFGGNQLGESSLSGVLAFLPASLGMGLVLVALGAVVRGAFAKLASLPAQH